MHQPLPPNSNASLPPPAGIVSLQLLITVLLTSTLLAIPAAKSYVFSSHWLLWAAFLPSLVIILVLMCYEPARKRHPWNMVLLGLFTLSMSSMVALISAAYATDIVLIAVGLTAGVVLCLTTYALQTKRDFTATGGTLFALLFVVFAASLVGLFFRLYWFHVLISGFAAFLFACYIIFDVQIMMGQGRDYALSPDEYVLAALCLYLDIVNFFVHMLYVVGACFGAR